MVSRVIFVLLSCLCVSYTTAFSDQIMQMVCKDACKRCTGSQGGTWCSICRCPYQLPDGLCTIKQCPTGETCRVSRGGWYRKQYAVCIPQSTTTTTTTTTTTVPTTLADGVCGESSDCRPNEACVISSGESVGTCKLVGGRTISQKCVEERRLETCRANFVRYFYNVTQGECQSFDYGGCNPGQNHFESMQDCQQECVAGGPVQAVVARDPDCLYPKEVGICRALLKSFYYNSDNDACEPFHYGGCGGNPNRFKTMDECVLKCPPST